MEGVLTEEHQEILRLFVAGRVVHDLGAGNLTLAHTLIQCGASRVVVVDRHEMLEPKVSSIERVTTWFDQYEGPIDIAFMSWPVNWGCGLLGLVERARLVIYLGNNMGGTMCGYGTLWEYLRTREVLAHVFGQKGSFIVYGPGRQKSRKPLPEEHAALDLNHVWTYEELKRWVQS